MKRKNKLIISGIGAILLGSLVLAPMFSLYSCSSNQSQQPPVTTTPPIVPTPQNEKFGYTIHGKDEITNRDYTNDEVNFDQAINNANNWLNNNISQDKVNKYFDIFINKYINLYQAQRSNCVTSKILNKNLVLNNKLVSGNIQIQFTITDNIKSNVYPYSKGDVEIHTFIFENNPIEPYINKVVSNFLSFRITPKYLKKEFRYVDSSKNRIIGIKNSTINFDMIDELTLQLNNSIFSIDPQKLIDNLYLYNSNKTSPDEKNILREVITLLLQEKANIIVWTNNNPLRPGITPSNPILEIQLSKNYTFSQSFANNLMWTLGSLFNFIPTKSGMVKIINNKIYFETTTLLYSSLNYPNQIVDLSSGFEKPLATPYVDVLSNNIFSNENDIKEALIVNNQAKINGLSWFDFLKNNDQYKRAKYVYDFILPFVSYGQQNVKYPSSIGGYYEKKVICEGYANLFSYVCNILQLTSITVTGQVKSNASESGQGGGHAWNLVRINNQWLWCDPTWDDGIGPNSSNYQESNFLLNTNNFFTPQTHLSVDNWNKGLDLPISIPQINSSALPTPQDLMIDGELKYNYVTNDISIRSKNEWIDFLNKYGVLKSFSLLMYMCADSPQFINQVDFENINIQVNELKLNNHYKFTITATSKSKKENFAKGMIFNAFNGSWKGANININDNIRFEFEVKRCNESTSNAFDYSKITLPSTNISKPFYWAKINRELILPFTSEFNCRVFLYVNNNNVLNSNNSWENRIWCPMVYVKNSYKCLGDSKALIPR